MLKKIGLIVLAIVLFTFVYSGCEPNTQDETDGSLSPNNTSNDTESPRDFVLEFGNGFYAEEKNDADVWHWCNKTGELSITNPFAEEKTVTLSFYAWLEEGKHIFFQQGETKHTINSGDAQLSLTLKPGNNIFELTTDAEKKDVQTDSRDLYFGMKNYSITQTSGIIGTGEASSRPEVTLTLDDIIEMHFLEGFYAEEYKENDYWRWCDETGRINITNSGTAEYEVTLSFYAWVPEGKNIFFNRVDNEQENTQAAMSGEASVTLVVQPGDNYFDLTTDAEKRDAPDDVRSLYFGLKNYQLHSVTN